MAKTKFFRVAVEGPTVDGREITREQIDQMAASYRPDTYTARINCEHLRGYSPDKPFNAWGSVAAVKAEDVDVEIGGKTQKRRALFAQFDVTDDAKSYNEAGQKLFSSVEIQPNFANTNKAYLVGLAFTDSPASIGTEVLKFSTRDSDRKDNLLQQDGFIVAYEEEDKPSDIMTAAFSTMRNFFSNAGKPVEIIAPPAVDPAQPASPDLAAFAASMGQHFETLSAGIAKSFAALETRVSANDATVKTLSDTFENTKSNKHSARPLTSGGSGRIRADC